MHRIDKKIFAVVFIVSVSLIYIIFNLVYSPQQEYLKLDSSKLKLYGELSDYYNAKKTIDSIQGFELSKVKYFANGSWNSIGGSIKLNIINRNKNYMIGDLVFIKGCKLKSSVSYVNSEGFFQNKYMQSLNIYARATVDEKAVTLLKRPLFNVKRSAYQIRYKLENSFRYIPENESRLIKAIVFGEDELDETVKNKFTAEGISHVMAVSGFNLAIIIVFINYICKKLRVNYKVNALIEIAAAWLFCIGVGMGPSILRAAFMSTVFILCRCLNIKCSSLKVLFFTALFMLCLNPNLIYSISFILSFGALAGILIFYKTFNKLFAFLPTIINSSLSMTISAQILLLPIFINLFNSVSLVSILTNLIVVPLASVITISGLITSLIGIVSIRLVYFLNIVNYLFAKLVLIIVDFTYNNFKTNIHISSVSIFICVVYYIFHTQIRIKIYKVSKIATCKSYFKLIIS